jgi:HPt (histidine-containing phosphotransfer) domain-containing protein
MEQVDLPASLYPLFLSSLEIAVQRLEESRARDDLEELGFHAHAIRGTCGAYGHEDLGEIAGVIETLADAGRREGIDEAIHRFCEEARGLLKAHKGDLER